MSRLVIYVPGTNDRAPGMLGNVERSLQRRTPRGEFRSLYLDYPAAYGDRMTYVESMYRGRMSLVEAIRRTPYHVVLVGYSQGAEIVGDVARRIATRIPGYTDLVVDAAVLIADPKRSGDELDHAGRDDTCGIRGERPVENSLFPIYQFAAPGDPIARLPRGNPLRAVAARSDMFSATPRQPGPWFDEARREVAEVGRIDAGIDWRQIGSALGYARGYAFGGRHTCYATETCPGTNVTYTERAAEFVSRLVS